MRADNVHLLRLADVYFTHAVNEDVDTVLDPQTLLIIFPTLQDNIASPHSQVSFIT